MFTSATQLIFAVTYTDASEARNKTEEPKASVRTESESSGVADSLARKPTKQYAKLLQVVAKQGTS